MNAFPLVLKVPHLTKPNTDRIWVRALRARKQTCLRTHPPNAQERLELPKSGELTMCAHLTLLICKHPRCWHYLHSLHSPALWFMSCSHGWSCQGLKLIFLLGPNTQMVEYQWIWRAGFTSETLVQHKADDQEAAQKHAQLCKVGERRTIFLPAPCNQQLLQHGHFGIDTSPICLLPWFLPSHEVGTANI